MEQYGPMILLSVVLGTLARILMLRSDYRQYPGYPHGYVTHISLGFVAAALGAVAIPALAEKEFTAVTFLALAAQQFREIRNMERESLKRLEEDEIIPRGNDYIEGIAKVFEARNYLVMSVSLGTCIIVYFTNLIGGLIVGLLIIYLAARLMRGELIRDIAEVVPAKLHFKGSLLMIEDIVIKNVGLQDSREKIINEGLAVLIKPKNDNARATLHNLGQRQAIIHVASTVVGTKAEVGEQEWNPLARKNIDTGAIGLFILPNEPDMKALIQSIELVPVLESSKRNILSTESGSYASD
ncbi:MAG: YIEGIA family protein [Bacillota bacterium]